MQTAKNAWYLILLYSIQETFKCGSDAFFLNVMWNCGHWSHSHRGPTTPAHGLPLLTTTYAECLDKDKECLDEAQIECLRTIKPPLVSGWTFLWERQVLVGGTGTPLSAVSSVCGEWHTVESWTHCPTNSLRRLTLFPPGGRIHFLVLYIHRYHPTAGADFSSLSWF